MRSDETVTTTTDVLLATWPQYYKRNFSAMPYFSVNVSNVGRTTSDIVVLGFLSSLGTLFMQLHEELSTMP